MRLSGILTLVGISALVLAVAKSAPPQVLFVTGLAACLLTTLSAAHGIAYVVREPDAGCVPCAAAKARREALKGRFPLSTSRKKHHDCKSCRKRSVEELVETADQLPKADQGLRALVESSREYRSINPRLLSSEPIDTWRVDSRHHFVYGLKPDIDGGETTALFVARWEDYAPMSAVLITPDPNGGEPEVVDLRA